MDKLDIINKDCININENSVNAINSKIDELILFIYDIDEKINESENKVFDILFKPFDEIYNKLENIYNDIEDEIYDIISIFKNKLDNAFENIINISKDLVEKAIETIQTNECVEIGLNEILKQGDKFYQKANLLIEKVGLKNPMELIGKFQTLCEGMDKYEKSSQIDETINILNDIIIEALINILSEALQNSEIGKFLKESSDALLKGMESMKKNLKDELKEIVALPERENSNNIDKLKKICDKNYLDIIKFKTMYEKIQNGFKNLMSIMINMISKNIIQGLKFPNESKTIMYINSKIGKNPLKKIIIKQSEILLRTLKDILPLLSNFIKNIISILKLNDDPYDSFRNLFSEFSNNSFNKIKDGLSESIDNIKIGILSLIKDLISGKLKNKNNDVILSWTDYFIKGIKVCSNVTEAETLSKLLIDNEIISIDGELNKKNILELKDLNNIKIKNFPVKLKLDLKKNYNELKSKIGNKIKNTINLNPKEIIMKMITETEKKINLKINEEIQSITQKFSNIFKDGINLILIKENECKKLIKSEINIYIEKLIKGAINNLKTFKEIIKVKSNEISNEANKLYSSMWDKINNFEEIINTSFKEITTSLINKVFCILELIKDLKTKFDLNILLDTVKKTSENIYNSILNIIKTVITQINQALATFKNFTGNVGQDINKKSTDILNSFLYRFNNDIRPFFEYIKNLEIGYNEININNFMLDKTFNPFSLLPIMNEIKEKKKTLDEILVNVIDKREEILNSIEDLILLINKIYDFIVKEEDNILNKLFAPCNNFIEKLEKISNEIQNKINSIIFPIISPIINDYLEKIKSYYFKLFSTFINKIDSIGNNFVDKIENSNKQLIQLEQKTVDIAEKGFKNIKNAFKKIKFYQEETLLTEITSLCKDIKDYDERGVEMEIIAELCSNIISEFKKMIKDCIKESELCTLLEKDYNSFIKDLGLN